MKIKKNKTLIYCCTLIFLSLIISVRPMILSTYISASSNSMVYYLCAFLPMAVLFFAVSKYSDKPAAPLACALASILTLGNASAMPLLRYTSAYEVENVLTYAKSLCMNSIITAFLVPITWGMIWICSKLYNKVKLRKWFCIAYANLSVMLAGVILFFSDKESETTIINLPGVSMQVALPVMVMSIIGIVLLWYTDNLKLRLTYMISVVIVNLALFLRGETGIPFVMFIAFSIWYYLLQPYKNTAISLGIPVLSGIGMAALLLIHLMRFKLPSSGFVHSLSEKIETRIFSDYVEQVERGIRSITTGGFWGSNAYNVNVPEASSDFCMATIIHYSGAVFVVLMIAVIIPMFYYGFSSYIQDKHSFSSELGNISLTVMFVMIFYNMMMCCGIIAVLGSQMVFTGVSLSYSILSGFLLGAITYSEEIISGTVLKLKGAFCHA